MLDFIIRLAGVSIFEKKRFSYCRICCIFFGWVGLFMGPTRRSWTSLALAFVNEHSKLALDVYEPPAGLRWLLYVAESHGRSWFLFWFRSKSTLRLIHLLGSANSLFFFEVTHPVVAVIIRHLIHHYVIGKCCTAIQDFHSVMLPGAF